MMLLCVYILVKRYITYFSKIYTVFGKWLKWHYHTHLFRYFYTVNFSPSWSCPKSSKYWKKIVYFYLNRYVTDIIVKISPAVTNTLKFWLTHYYSSKQWLHLAGNNETAHDFIYLLRKYAFSNILKISPPKTEFSDKNSDIFHISAQIIDYGYSLEPPRRGGSNEYPKSMFLSRHNKK